MWKLWKRFGMWVVHNLWPPIQFCMWANLNTIVSAVLLRCSGYLAEMMASEVCSFLAMSVWKTHISCQFKKEEQRGGGDTHTHTTNEAHRWHSRTTGLKVICPSDMTHHIFAKLIRHFLIFFVCSTSTRIRCIFLTHQMPISIQVMNKQNRSDTFTYTHTQLKPECPKHHDMAQSCKRGGRPYSFLSEQFTSLLNKARGKATWREILAASTVATEVG